MKSGVYTGATEARPTLADLIARERIRSRIETAIARLIDALDAFDGPAEDMEPEYELDDVADDIRGEGDTSDDEPSLGAPERGPSYSQVSWACGRNADGEAETECEDEGADHDGCEPPEDSEPALGWTNHVNQEKANAIRGWNGGSGESEPSLGAALNHHDQRHWSQGGDDDVEFLGTEEDVHA